jgi:hypothetical protein
MNMLLIEIYAVFLDKNLSIIRLTMKRFFQQLKFEVRN